MEEPDCCFICLGSESSEQEGLLETVCQCSRHPVHRKCLARWQLQSAGRNEESTCRFCLTALPDWRQSLTPATVKPVTPVMAIKFEGKVFKLRVQPGPEGLQRFKDQIRQLLGFDITTDFEVSFEFQVPSTGEKLKLNGLNSYGAATHCAAITAGERSAQRAPAADDSQPSLGLPKDQPPLIAAHEHRSRHHFGHAAGHSTSRRTTTASVPEPSSINTPLRTTRGFSAAGLAPSRTPLAATEAHVNVASLWQTSMSASELTLRSAHANGSPSEVRSLTVRQMPCPDAPAPGGQASVTTAVQRMPVLSQAREAFKKGVQGVHALLGI